MPRSFAHPGRFMRLTQPLLPLGAIASFLFFGWGLYLALIASPPDYQQGEVVRIMYVHVPAAWLSLLIYGTLALAAIGTLAWRHPLADIYIKAATPLGTSMTMLCLITGSLWGKPMWGAWWVWDARLTSMLMLLFLYLGALALRNAFDDPERASRASALLLLVGAVNLPVIKFSVYWWNTLHQPASVLRWGWPSIQSSLLIPLLVMTGGYLLFTMTLIIIRMHTLLMEQRKENLELGLRP